MAMKTSVLRWIIAFKAFKATTLTALGIALLTTRHTDPVDLLFRLALAIHLPLTSELLDRALNFVLGLTVGKQTALALTAFFYAALMATEGIGLALGKAWARWFTIIATGSLIPIEVYEILRAPHALRVLILLLNVAVVVYLARRRKSSTEAHGQSL
jgi:uncharacterized membrane protein (DUF2068 family)